ncbi:hypothetical protein D3C73_721260 [compost metagenome]
MLCTHITHNLINGGHKERHILLLDPKFPNIAPLRPTFNRFMIPNAPIPGTRIKDMGEIIKIVCYSLVLIDDFRYGGASAYLKIVFVRSIHGWPLEVGRVLCRD